MMKEELFVVDGEVITKEDFEALVALYPMAIKKKAMLQEILKSAEFVEGVFRSAGLFINKVEQHAGKGYKYYVNYYRSIDGKYVVAFVHQVKNGVDTLRKIYNNEQLIPNPIILDFDIYNEIINKHYSITFKSGSYEDSKISVVLNGKGLLNSRTGKRDKRNKYLHEFVCEFYGITGGSEIDHITRNHAICTKSTLRSVTSSQNKQNTVCTKKPTLFTSNPQQVYLDKSCLLYMIDKMGLFSFSREDYYGMKELLEAC